MTTSTLGRPLRRAVLAGAAVLGVLVVAQAPASAAPGRSGCVSGYNGPFTGYLHCNSGGGRYRAIVSCDDFWWDYTRYGPWVTPGYTSSAVCDYSSSGGDRAHNLRVEIFVPVGQGVNE